MSNDYTQDIIAALIKGDAYEMRCDTVTLSHSAWSESLNFTRNYVPGGVLSYDGVDYVYVPFTISRAGQDGNLEQTWSITLQDLNTIVQQYEDQIPIDSTEYIQIEIRTLSYDKRTGAVTLLEGPYVTDTDSVDYDNTTSASGAQITAKAERVNVNGTGMKMTPARFPTLRPLMQ